MIIEHLAFNVHNPAEVAAWYVKAFEMRLGRALGAPFFAHFVVDATGHTVLEFLNNANVPVPDYAAINPFNLHIAFLTTDIRAEHARLLTLGATVEDAIATNAAGDQLVYLRDPWGLTVQLVQRVQPLLP